ncbi:Ig-like domain-containing protein [Streptomyces bugieae]|uniref:Ig-like domain-containing protein n=1 Tax=Streptomyces bugieae TaxID=3098223 RepID=A0ABU7NMT2_9ACTN|nr:Ig-like domain-containing protein [Streptomyces sp. DSM 41528]
MPLRPSPRRRPWRTALALAGVVGAGTLTACGGGAAPGAQGTPVRVTLGAANGTRTVQAGDRLRVTAQGGVLTEVTVADPRGRRLPGGLGGGGTVWTASAPAAPDTRYSVLARTKDDRGGEGVAKESLTTATAARLDEPAVAPDGVAPGGGRHLAKADDPNLTIGRTCTDSAPGRDCGKVRVGEPSTVTASSVRGKDDTTIGIGDWNAEPVPGGRETAPSRRAADPFQSLV